MFIGPTLPTVMSSMYQINSCTLQKLGKTRHKQNPLFKGIKGNRAARTRRDIESPAGNLQVILGRQ